MSTIKKVMNSLIHSSVGIINIAKFFLETYQSLRSNVVTLINHARFLFHLILSIFRIPSPACWNQPRLEWKSESFVSNFKHSSDHLKTPILHLVLKMQRTKYLNWDHICHISAEKMKTMILD